MKQFKSVLDLIRAFPDEQSCIDYLETQRWPNGVISPFDPSSKVYRCKDKFRCRKTGKNFSVRTGTIFQDSKLPLQKWFIALFLFSSHKRGLSSYQLAKDLGVKQSTAYFILQRLRNAFEHPEHQNKLQGIIQIDEAYVGGRNINRHKDKKIKYNTDREFPDKTPVIGLISDTGTVRCFVTDNVRKVTVQPIVYHVVREDSTIVTDEWMAYNGLSNKYWHESVDHSKKQYLNDSGFTTNKIENYWSVLKRTLGGTYIKVSREYLQRYCNEISFRFNTKDITTKERFDMVLQNSEGTLKYREMVDQNKTRYNYRNFE